MNTRQARANSGNRIAIGILVIIVSLFCFLSNVHALGGVGRMVYSFLVGFFGLASYAYSLMGIIAGVAITFNVRVKQRFSKILVNFGLLLLAIFALHIYTSSGHIIGAGYGKYLVNCYDNTNTAGGMLFGVVAFPLMKALTGVGALVVACAAFFAIAAFALIPTIKKNVVYGATSKQERKSGNASNGQKSRRERKIFAFDKKKSEPAAYKEFEDTTAREVGSERQLYVAEAPGDPMMGARRRGRAFGSDGYRPLSGFDPLYPNKAAGVEDEEPVRPTPYPQTPSYRTKKEAAREILFGEAGTAGLDTYDSLREENKMKPMSNVGAPYSAIKRQELGNKLGIDGIDNSIREEYMARRRANAQDDGDRGYNNQLPASAQGLDRSESRREQPQNGDNAGDFGMSKGTVDFDALKRESIRSFGELPPTEYGNAREEEPRKAEPQKAEETAESVVSEPQPAVKREVVQPTRRRLPGAAQETARGVDNAEVNVGMLGAINKANLGAEAARPVQRQEAVSEGYNRPSNVVERRPAFEEQSTVTAAKQAVSGMKSAPAQGVERNAPAPQTSVRKASEAPKMPRAFLNNAVDQNAAKQSVEQYRTQRADLNREKPKVEDSVPVGETPQEPLPEQRRVRGDMSRTELQATTDIKHLSGKDVEKAEMGNRIRSLKKSMDAQPSAGSDESASLKEQKQKAAEKRGIQPTSRPKVVQTSIEQAIEQAEKEERAPRRPYSAPPIDLLEPPAPEVEQNEDYELKKEKIITTLNLFNITGEVSEILVGPTFTMYKLKVTMPRGRTINYISSLENDIAMKMEVSSVRIIAPIPGEDAVGIEVPNKFRRNVNLSEILMDPEFNKASDPASFALGKNLFGQSRIVAIRKLPHVLIAGATGAGKSCCINSLIISLLYKASPDDVRFILIDPKKVELSVYEGIPHLLMDEIICEMDKAIRALNWAISEMQRRIDYLQKYGYRNIEDFNADCSKLGLEKIPRIVIIVDEFAELMSMGKKAVEDAVNRLTRLARAAGIHLVLATQRPSVDVISGTIKNNLPSRIAFKVTQSFDSKTVLDTIGAEKLLGYGDLMFMTPGSSSFERMQGAFISDRDVIKVVDFIKKNNDCYFDDNIKEAIFNEQEEQTEPAAGKGKAKPKNNGVSPEILDALELGIQMKEEDKPYSISNIQRKLGFGYPKAAKIYDMIEKMGYLSPYHGDAKKREVNISYEELEELRDMSGSEDEEE